MVFFQRYLKIKQAKTTCISAKLFHYSHSKTILLFTVYWKIQLNENWTVNHNLILFYRYSCDSLTAWTLWLSLVFVETTNQNRSLGPISCKEIEKRMMMGIWSKKFSMNFVETGLLNCRILSLYHIILICYGSLLFENLATHSY